MEHNLTQKQVLDLATSIGYYIIKNGGEINRAEDTARRIGVPASRGARQGQPTEDAIFDARHPGDRCAAARHL